MTKQIHDTAAKLLEQFKALGLHSATFDGSASFADATIAAKTFIKEAAPLLADDAFGFIRCDHFPSWTHVTNWLGSVERQLEAMAKPQAEGWVCFRALGKTSRIRRYNKAWSMSSTCQRLVDGVWTACALTVADAVGLLGTPEYFECSEQGEPLQQLKMAKPEPQGPQWVYFVMKGTTGTIRRYDATGTDKAATYYKDNSGEWHPSVLTSEAVRMNVKAELAVLCNEFGSALEQPEPAKVTEPEATDPATGISYRIDKDGHILSRRSNDVSWCAAPCTIHVLQAVQRLGLIAHG